MVALTAMKVRCEVPIPSELLRALELVHAHGPVGSWRPRLGIQALFG